MITELKIRTLDEIAIQHGTDKASKHPVLGHDYCRVYERFFKRHRFSLVKILEIGVGGGESIRTWLDYFPHGSVFGVDNVQGTNDWNTVGHRLDPRYCFTYGDQSDPTFWQCYAVDYGLDWDIIIDDGGHFNNQIIIAFNGLWPILREGGLYCIEDLGVAYGAGSVFVKPEWPNHIDWLRQRIDQMNTGNEIDFLHLTKELAIIKKA